MKKESRNLFDHLWAEVRSDFLGYTGVQIWRAKEFWDTDYDRYSKDFEQFSEDMEEYAYDGRLSKMVHDMFPSYYHDKKTNRLMIDVVVDDLKLERKYNKHDKTDYNSYDIVESAITQKLISLVWEMYDF